MQHPPFDRNRAGRQAVARARHAAGRTAAGRIFGWHCRWRSAKRPGTVASIREKNEKADGARNPDPAGARAAAFRDTHRESGKVITQTALVYRTGWPCADRAPRRPGRTA